MTRDQHLKLSEALDNLKRAWGRLDTVWAECGFNGGEIENYPFGESFAELAIRVAEMHVRPLPRQHVTVVLEIEPGTEEDIDRLLAVSLPDEVLNVVSIQEGNRVIQTS